MGDQKFDELMKAGDEPLKGTVDDDARPLLDCDQGDLHAITIEAWKLLAYRNTPETLFRRAGSVIRVERGRNEKDSPFRLAELKESALCYEVAQRLRCMKTRRAMFGRTGSREDCAPSIRMIRNMLAMPNADVPLPYLSDVAEVPVLTPQGKLLLRPGYDKESKLLYIPYDPAVDLRVPDNPTDDDLTKAKATIEDVIGQFPFASEADKTNAIAVMIAPFVRPHIEGATPLHQFEAPGPGVGKGLLVRTVLYPAFGDLVGVSTYGKNDDELEKRITARLWEGYAITFFDNVTRNVDSGVLAAAITAYPLWEGRRLGKTEMLRVPATTLWVMTANNSTLSMEIARRTVRIRLDPKMERPWLRTGFKHENLMDWVKQERAALIRAVLVLIQRWLCEGRPVPTMKPLGSFEKWTHVVGGILRHNGYPDFMANKEELYEMADSEGDAWRVFLTCWWETFGDRIVTTKHVHQLIVEKEVDGIDLGKSTEERSQRTRLGLQLRKRRDVVMGPYRIEEAGVRCHAARYRLRYLVQPGEEPPVTSTEPFSPSIASEVPAATDELAFDDTEDRDVA